MEFCPLKLTAISPGLTPGLFVNKFVLLFITGLCPVVFRMV